MEKSGQGVGRCKFAFWFAVFHDVLGLLILLSGVFWDIFFNDLLIYSGAVVIFLSLIWWVFWYSGNIEFIQEKWKTQCPEGELASKRHQQRKYLHDLLYKHSATRTILQPEQGAVIHIIRSSVKNAASGQLCPVKQAND
ncbi:hypothetical protein PHYPO_G00034900 [Pangasianodon hypophthalmus]|uniref:Uncharacterized protein n=1 Tax=Pangasianodon hypophthalmus TaxID=310915 RepID=A0A5N5MKP2_PANHP|nr:hypothetical protein PHYPO_G00034900 [Pangasianodon hypophthalmus]